MIIGLTCATSSAFAQPAGAQAEVLFREGRQLLAKGKTAEACSAFEQSQKLEAAISTLLNLASCRESNGQLATAWGLFLDAERQTRGASDPASRKLHDTARARADKLEPKVSKLTISVPERSQITGLTIARGDDAVEQPMWNRALPIDGGTYTVTARAPGTNAWSTTVIVAAQADTKTIDIPDLRNLARDLGAPAEAKPMPVPARVIAPRAKTPTEDDDDSSVDAGSGSRSSSTMQRFIAPIAVGGGSLVLLGGAVGFHLWGGSTYQDAQHETTSQARRDSLESSANTKRYVAEGLAVAGVAAAGVAVWLYLRTGTTEQPVRAATRVMVSPTGVALSGSF